MDFITELPESSGCTNMLVITDRLGKGVMATALKRIDAESVAEWFLGNYFPVHFLPFAIVSDRGTQFVGAFWKRVCKILRIKRRLSTAYSPETDGSTERMNQEVETYLRGYVGFTQDDWKTWLGVAVGTLSNRDSSVTGTSPFFMAHGWHPSLVDFKEELSQDKKKVSPIGKADRILRRLQEVRDWAQSAMALAQQRQEETANRHRDGAVSFQEGDKVWLDLSKITTTRPSKKLDAKYGKFTVIEVIGSHAYRLDTPPGIHNVFPTRRLKLANRRPLPGQVVTDPQPVGIISDTEVEYEIERILKEKKGRGGRREYLVKWEGYARPTWEPRSALEETVALDSWERGERSA